MFKLLLVQDFHQHCSPSQVFCPQVEQTLSLGTHLENEDVPAPPQQTQLDSYLWQCAKSALLSIAKVITVYNLLIVV